MTRRERPPPLGRHSARSTVPGGSPAPPRSGYRASGGVCDTRTDAVLQRNACCSSVTALGRSGHAAGNHGRSQEVTPAPVLAAIGAGDKLLPRRRFPGGSTMQMNAERLHEVRRRALYLFRRCVTFPLVAVGQLFYHGRFFPRRPSRPDAVFWLNAQTAAHKRGATEITPADLQVAVDAGSELQPRYGFSIPTYSADASRLVQDAIASAGGRLNVAAIENLRAALASWWATESDSKHEPTRCSPAT